MIRTQIYLTEEEQKSLSTIAQQEGKKKSELIRFAIDELIAKYKPNRLVSLRKGRGLWAKRKDLPDFTALRKEFDR